MKKIIITVFILTTTTVSYCQFLTQSAEGKSSIPLPLNGAGIGVDIGKSEVTFGLNNYENVLSGKRKFLLGLNLSAKNSEGLANLFSSGSIVPQSDFLGFAGFSVSNNNSMIRQYNESKNVELLTNERKTKDSLFLVFKKEMKEQLFLASLKIKREIIRNEIIKEITLKIEEAKSIVPIRKYLKEFEKNGLDTFKEDLLKRFELKEKEYREEYNKVSTEYNKLINQEFDQLVSKLIPFRSTFFLLGGINARSFTRFLQLSTPDFSKSFQDTLFRGGTFGLGVNLQVKNFWLGVTYSYIQGDNFSNLKSKEYTLRTTDSSGNQTLLREKKIIAYSGKYSRVETNQLNIDLIGEFNLSDTSRLLASLYLRSSLYSRDNAYLKNYTNIGTGLYFINKKGKFLGGLYIELPDINNNFEKAKPENEINIRSPLRKLSFGIVTKFNLSSIFAWSNRPAKPD